MAGQKTNGLSGLKPAWLPWSVAIFLGAFIAVSVIVMVDRMTKSTVYISSTDSDMLSVADLKEQVAGHFTPGVLRRNENECKPTSRPDGPCWIEYEKAPAFDPFTDPFPANGRVAAAAFRLGIYVPEETDIKASGETTVTEMTEEPVEHVVLSDVRRVDEGDRTFRTVFTVAEDRTLRIFYLSPQGDPTIIRSIRRTEANQRAESGQPYKAPGGSSSDKTTSKFGSWFSVLGSDQKVRSFRLDSPETSAVSRPQAVVYADFEPAPWTCDLPAPDDVAGAASLPLVKTTFLYPDHWLDEDAARSAARTGLARMVTSNLAIMSSSITNSEEPQARFAFEGQAVPVDGLIHVLTNNSECMRSTTSSCQNLEAELHELSIAMRPPLEAQDDEPTLHLYLVAAPSTEFLLAPFTSSDLLGDANNDKYQVVSCGVAASTPARASLGRTFAVISPNCLETTPAHEWGHLIGFSHQLWSDPLGLARNDAWGGVLRQRWIDGDDRRISQEPPNRPHMLLDDTFCNWLGINDTCSLGTIMSVGTAFRVPAFSDARPNATCKIAIPKLFPDAEPASDKHLAAKVEGFVSDTVSAFMANSSRIFMAMYAGQVPLGSHGRLADEVGFSQTSVRFLLDHKDTPVFPEPGPPPPPPLPLPLPPSNGYAKCPIPSFAQGAETCIPNDGVVAYFNVGESSRPCFTSNIEAMLDKPNLVLAGFADKSGNSASNLYLAGKRVATIESMARETMPNVEFSGCLIGSSLPPCYSDPYTDVPLIENTTCAVDRLPNEDLRRRAVYIISE